MVVVCVPTNEDPLLCFCLFAILPTDCLVLPGFPRCSDCGSFLKSIAAREVRGPGRLVIAVSTLLLCAIGAATPLTASYRL